MSWCSEYCNSLRMSMLFLTDIFLSLSVLGQLGEAHWLWFRRSSSGSGSSGAGILVPRIVPPAHFRGRDSTVCTYHTTEDKFLPPQPNDQDNNHNYQCHCYKSTNDPSCNPPSTTTTGGGGPGSSTIYIKERTFVICMYSAAWCLSHALLTGRISGGWCACLCRI